MVTLDKSTGSDRHLTFKRILVTWPSKVQKGQTPLTESATSLHTNWYKVKVRTPKARGTLLGTSLQGKGRRDERREGVVIFLARG